MLNLLITAFWWLIQGIQTILLWLVYSHSILITQNISFCVRKITSVDSIQIKPNSLYVPILSLIITGSLEG